MKKVCFKKLIFSLVSAMSVLAGCDHVISSPESGSSRPSDIGGIEIGGSIEKFNASLEKITTVEKSVSEHVKVTEDIMAYKAEVDFPKQLGPLKEVELWGTPIGKRIYKLESSCRIKGDKISEKSKVFEDLLDSLRKEFKVKDGESDGFFGEKKHTFKMADVEIVLSFQANDGNLRLVAKDLSLEPEVEKESHRLPQNQARWNVVKGNQN